MNVAHAQTNVLKAASAYIQAIHENQRVNPRVKVERRARVTRSDGTSINAELHDISSDAVQIRCDRARARRLHPSEEYLLTDESPKAVLSFTLPLWSATAEVTVACRMTYCAIRSDGDAAFGFMFENLSEVHRELIAKYIDQVGARQMSNLEQPDLKAEIARARRERELRLAA